MDKLTSMKVFATVARLGSFTAAAEEMGISRAMASKYMSDLENSLDVRLLNRTTRQLSLTEVGSTYQVRINNILAEIEETEQAITQLQSEPRGILKIMAPPSFGSFHLARILGNYMERYPEVAIEMILTDRAPDLFEEGLDLAIWIGKLEESNLIARKLATTRSVVCGSPEYFAHKGIPKTPADLAQHNCLTFSTRTPYSDWKFMLNGKITTLHPMGTFRSNSADPLRIASINNCGLVQLPTYIVGLDIQSGRLQPVLENFEPEPLAINVVYIHRRHLSTKARTFVDFISEQFQPVPYWEKWIREN